MDTKAVHEDGWQETHYTDVDWTYPPLRCPHSCGASASRLMRLLAQRTHKTCGSKKPCISVVDRRVYPTLIPTASYTSLSSATSSSMFTSHGLSSVPTTPPSSPSKCTQSSTPSQPHAVLSSYHSINTKSRRLAGVELQHHCQLSCAKPPFYHASLLRSSLPRRKGNFRKSSRPAVDFFREEVTKPGGFARTLIPKEDVLGRDTPSMAVHVAEAVLCSYETRSAFFGWYGLSLTGDLYDTKRTDNRTRQRSRSHRNSLDVLIAEEDVDEGREKWLQMTRELVGPITLRSRSRLDTVSQPPVARSSQPSYNQASQRLVQSSGQTRFMASGQMKTKDLENGAPAKDFAPNWWYNPPSTSVQLNPVVQPVTFGLNIPQGSLPKLGFSQVVGSGSGNVHPSSAAGRCAPPGKDGALSMPEPSASLSHKPSTLLQATSAIFPSRLNASFQLADVTSSNAIMMKEVHQDGRSKKDTAIMQIASSRKSDAAPSVPPAFHSTHPSSESASRTAASSVSGTLKPTTSDGNTVQRRPQSAGGGIERERSRYIDLDLSLRALVGSLPSGVGLRKDAQGFWEPVTPPCSPRVIREQEARSARSRSTDGSPSSCGDSPDSNMRSTPASTAVSSATSPPPDSPGSYCLPESQSLYEYLDLPNPTSLLPAFLGSAGKRKRSSRTREIVDRLKLNNVGADDDASDNGTVPDTGGGTSQWSSRDGLEDALSVKSARASSGTAVHSTSPGSLAAAASSVASSKSTSSEVTGSKVSRDKGKPASNSRSVSAGPVSVNGRVVAPGVGIHRRSLSGAQNHPPVYNVPPGPSGLPAGTVFTVPPAQLAPPLHAPFPPGIHPQPQPRSAPIAGVPAQQPGFYVPVYPVYAYPVAPPVAQPLAQGPWMLGYRPPQGTVHVPTQATITGVSGMRHINW